MGRPRKPYFRASDRWWVSRFRGQYVKLARGLDNEAAARQRFHELMALEALRAPAESPTAATAALLEAFLDWSNRHNEPSTYESYRAFLQSFCDQHGAVPVRDLKPYHVTRWLDGQPGWGQSTRRGAITAVKRALNWAVDEGLLPANPLKQVKKPPVKRRDRVLSPQEQQAIAAAPRDQAFRQFLLALEQTGCRPGEVAAVTAAEVDLDAGTWTLPRHKTVKKTHKPRVVYLTPPLVELCRRLVAQRPTGPLFLNSRGRPWSRNAVRCRFRRLRSKLNLGRGVVAYAYRHTFATAGLEEGVSLAAMAELLGHTSTEMVSEHYGHLDQRAAHLREAARRAAGQRAGA
jgi:integrase